MKTFTITYTDPETEELVEVEKDFEDSETVSAKEWAEDYAYMLSDKGRYSVSENK